jgi:hypothetical protein
MTWVTLFPLRSAAVRPCTPRHFCFIQTPFFPLKLRGLAKSKLPPARGKKGGHVLLESVTHVMRLSQAHALPRPTNWPSIKLRIWNRSVRMQSENKRILEASRIARAHWVPMRLAFAQGARAFPAAPIQQRQRSRTRGEWPHIYGS